MGLYQEDTRMAVIGMGRLGLITRVAAPFMGAEFTFASPEQGRETAPGQIDREKLTELIYQIREQFQTGKIKTNPMNSFGRIFRISIFGESHGSGVGVVIDG